MTEANINKRAGAEAKIEISLSRLSQLFNSFDPSPFHERDLDPDAKEYTVGSAEEVARHAPLCLVVHLPADQLPNSAVTDLGPSIHNYFAYRAESERRRLRLLFHDGRIALVTGLAFLFCCVLVRELAFAFLAGASDIVAESMLIIGWVANTAGNFLIRVGAWWLAAIGTMRCDHLDTVVSQLLIPVKISSSSRP
jgi:hypothetical protein